MHETVTREELHEALATWAGALEQRINAHTSAEIARHVTASEERIRTELRACFEPHDGVPKRVTKLEDLVPRVERLEAKVFAKRRSPAPKRRRAAKR